MPTVATAPSILTRASAHWEGSGELDIAGVQRDGTSSRFRLPSVLPDCGGAFQEKNSSLSHIFYVGMPEGLAESRQGSRFLEELSSQQEGCGVDSHVQHRGSRSG